MGHRTVWRRTDGAIRDFRIQEGVLSGVQKGSMETAQQLREIRRLLELATILRYGPDIDASAPQYTTAEEIWLMKKEDWVRLLKPWE